MGIHEEGKPYAAIHDHAHRGIGTSENGLQAGPFIVKGRAPIRGKSIALGDDMACRAMIDFDAAQAILAAHVRPIGETESVPLAAAAGRRLAAPVVACIDAPRQDCAATDGYAIRDDDLAAGLRAFRCIATVCAGQKAPAPSGPARPCAS